MLGRHVSHITSAKNCFFFSYPYPRSGTNPHVERQSNEKLTGFDFGFYSPRIKLRSVRRCNPLYVADDTKLIIPVQVRWIEFPPCLSEGSISWKVLY